MEQSKTQEEQFRHQWNQQLVDKDIIIVELQDKLDSVLQPRMSSARSRDELETISDNEGGLVAITKQLHHVVQSITVRIFRFPSKKIAALIHLNDGPFLLLCANIFCILRPAETIAHPRKEPVKLTPGLPP